MIWIAGTTERTVSETAHDHFYSDGVTGTYDPLLIAWIPHRAMVRFTHEQDVLAFAHGHLLRILAARWLGQDPRFGQHLVLSPATISILGTERDEPALEAWNATSF